MADQFSLSLKQNKKEWALKCYHIRLVSMSSSTLFSKSFIQFNLVLKAVVYSE